MQGDAARGGSVGEAVRGHHLKCKDDELSKRGSQRLWGRCGARESDDGARGG